MWRHPLPIVGLAIALVSAVLAVVLYDRLPGSMPVHWNVHGMVDGSVTKPWGAFLYPCMIAAAAMLAAVLPAISPKGFRIEPFARAFDLIMMTMIALATLLMAAVFAGALGAPAPVDRIIPASMGMILLVMGNVLGKTTRNFFIGVRTPWTLASPEVWLRTHRLGGRLLILAALVFFGAAVLKLDLLIPFTAVIAAAIICVAYSYLLYRRLEGHDVPTDGQ